MTESADIVPDAFERMLGSRPEIEWYRLGSLPGFTPQIGALVGMMAYTRMTTLQAVRGLSVEELDTIPDGFSNSIGMLLAHIAAVDRMYHIFCFRGLQPYTTEEFQLYLGAVTFGKEGERVTGRSLDELLNELESSRADTLAELSQRDDAWLSTVATGWDDFQPDQHWSWFHVMEDEVSHRGQIRLIRKDIKAAQAR